MDRTVYRKFVGYHCPCFSLIGTFQNIWFEIILEHIIERGIYYIFIELIRQNITHISIFGNTREMKLFLSSFFLRLLLLQ